MFVNDLSAPIYNITLSLHDALSISETQRGRIGVSLGGEGKPLGSVARLVGLGLVLASPLCDAPQWLDRKSTRLNSSHRCISCAVFCLKKKIVDDSPDRIARLLSR